MRRKIIRIGEYNVRLYEYAIQLLERRKRPLGLVGQVSDFNLSSKNNVKVAKCFKKECWGNIILTVFIPSDHSVHCPRTS